MQKSKTPVLETYRIIEIRRPHLTHILKFIDREFQVIYINKDAAPNAKVVWLK